MELENEENRTLCAPVITDRGTTSEGGHWDWEDENSYHLHCQKTVLSAYNGGSGATWEVIDSLTLNNLPSDWKTLFTQEVSIPNITYDLAAILQLINKVSGTVSNPQFKLKFQDVKGGRLPTESNPEQRILANGTTYTFKFGRPVSIGFKESSSSETAFAEFKFHSMYYDSENDVTNIDLKKLDFQFADEPEFDSIRTLMSNDDTVRIPTHKIVTKVGNTLIKECTVAMPGVNDENVIIPEAQLSFNNQTPGAFFTTGPSNGIKFAAASPGLKTVNLATDRNRIFATNQQDVPKTHIANTEINGTDYFIQWDNPQTPATPIWVVPQWDWHVERINIGGEGSISMTKEYKIGFVVTNWQNWNNLTMGQQICEIELHIRNNTATTRTIENLSSIMFAFPKNRYDTQPSEIITRQLTDLKTIDPSYTNVYIFRYDSYLKRMVNSLAYRYN